MNPNSWETLNLNSQRMAGVTESERPKILPRRLLPSIQYPVAKPRARFNLGLGDEIPPPVPKPRHSIITLDGSRKRKQEQEDTESGDMSDEELGENDSNNSNSWLTTPKHYPGTSKAVAGNRVDFGSGKSFIIHHDVNSKGAISKPKPKNKRRKMDEYSFCNIL